ncbi:MAG: sugar phosphate isomerase/epimerase family protein [Desulfobulbaceae bacterium]|nr:sugar phosphate isomerase/epimerase family protein [Desulfobulbaceae bacterium]
MNDQDLRRYSAITGSCYINAPYDQLQQGLLEFFVQHRLQPEIGLEGDCLWNADRDAFQATADILKKNGLNCTLHAPFFDLAPGGIDPKIREITRAKLRLAFDLLPVFQPRSIVCHLGYEENKHSYKMEQWLRYSLETWRELLETAARNNTSVMFENTFEKTPDIHHRLLTEINSPFLRFCLDTGHLAAYAGTPWQLWLDRLLPWLGQLHLHDNKGQRDDHIAIGHGLFNFRELFDFLRSNKIRPIITLEPHTREDLWLSLESMEKNKLLEDIIN